ncbi:MAG: TolC family protein [Bacteroidales bacterium]|jgi:outer membrane protein TolC|nr:TolC family protein [Bacteroidales bacterium]
MKKTICLLGIISCCIGVYPQEQERVEILTASEEKTLNISVDREYKTTIVLEAELSRLTLTDAIAEGLKNNFSILLARNNEQISNNNVTPGNAGMLPSVTLNGTATKGIADSNMEFATGGSQDRTGAKSTNLNGNVALDWTIFDGLTMFANYDRLKALQVVGRENFRSVLQETVAAIMTVYFDIVSRQQELDAMKHILEISRRRLRSANDLFQAGKVSKVDLLSAQVDYNADTASYIQQTEGLRDAKIRINQLLARDIDGDFRVADTIVIDQTLIYGTILDKALSENPDVIISRMEASAAGFTLKAAQGARYPVVRITSSYVMAQQNSESGQISQNKSNTFNYGATASIPLFRGFNINREIKNAKLEKESAELRYEEMRKAIETQVARAYSAYEVNRKLALFETANLGLAADNLDVSMERYRFGAISAIELRDVQRSYISATNRTIVAVYNAKVAETALKLLTGEVMAFD